MSCAASNFVYILNSSSSHCVCSDCVIIAVCCRTLQCVAVCCSVSQCVVKCFSVLLNVTGSQWVSSETLETFFWLHHHYDVLPGVVMSCIVLLCAADCCSNLQKTLETLPWLYHHHIFHPVFRHIFHPEWAHCSMRLPVLHTVRTNWSFVQNKPHGSLKQK